ncbi:MAG: feruloyl-CoA synthase [Methylovirgula sp.]
MAHPTTAPLREVDLGPLDMEIDRHADGTIRARSFFRLGVYEESVTVRLDHWAGSAPDRIFLAERDGGDGWRHLTFAEARAGARALGQALLERGLDAQHPLVILSGNSIAHALLGLAALYVGIPYAPVSPAYSLVSRDFAKLKQIVALLTPGLVFAEDARFGAAIAACVPEDVEILVCEALSTGCKATEFSSLLATQPTQAVDAAHGKIGGDTIAKILFTSGSMAAPKGVVTNHRMLCANQAMIAHALPFLCAEPPVLVDWLPWHHSFGGNHNFGMALHHGGTLYIDQGRPTETGIAATVRALRDISPTIYFNVPKGFDALLPYLAKEPALARTFFRRLQLNFFAGASLPHRTLVVLDEIAAASCGERIGMISGFGATETAPSVLFQTNLTERPIDMARPPVGLPLPGNELKLVPLGDKYEARVKGPNVMPGYWRDAELTRQAFDDEGFYRLGDALSFVAESEPGRGFVFEGRISEDFKLSNGTTVNVGPLRGRLFAAGAPYLHDVVIAGESRDAIRVLIFPDLDACRHLAGDLAASAPAREILAHPVIREKFHAILADVSAGAGGASERVMRAALLAEPASIDCGEITDKGTLNQRAVLASRSHVVALLYATAESALLIEPRQADPRLDKWHIPASARPKTLNN